MLSMAGPHPGGWWPGQSESGHGEAVAVATGLHVLPEQAPVLRGGVSAKQSPGFPAAPPRSPAGVTGQCRLYRPG